MGGVAPLRGFAFGRHDPMAVFLPLRLTAGGASNRSRGNCCSAARLGPHLPPAGRVIPVHRNGESPVPGA